MRNKGQIEMSVGTIVTIVLLITCVILGIVLIKSIFSEPEFKITKEVCVYEINKTIEDRVYDNYYLMEDTLEDKWHESGCWRYEKFDIDLEHLPYICKELKNDLKENIDYLIYNLRIIEIFNKIEVCEDVEVEEVEVKIKLSTLEYLFLDMSKEELTIDWLDENCEKNYHCEVADLVIIENSDISEISLGDKPCEFKNYQCQLYKVEVLE